jgi:hypothetical protein
MNGATIRAKIPAFLLVLLALNMTAQCRMAQGAQTPDPLILYGPEITFDVFRDGNKVGRHSVAFSRQSSGALLVNARFELAITFLAIPVYEYFYRSTAVWRNGRLTTLTSDVDDDGKKSSVRLQANGTRLIIKGKNGELDWPAPVYPTNHWHAGVLSQKQVLNTLNGNISSVTITPAGRDQIRAQGTLVEATRYEYSGDIETTVWYDDSGRWVKMQFTAKNGSVIDYQCTRCGLGRAERAALN